MKKVVNKKRLVLTQENVRQLGQDRLVGVAGGRAATDAGCTDSMAILCHPTRE